MKGKSDWVGFKMLWLSSFKMQQVALSEGRKGQVGLL